MSPIGIVMLVLGVFTLFGCGTTQRADGGSGLLPPGSPAPAVGGRDQNGARIELKETLGSPTVVYFYPKDETPGCTKEACAFRDVWQKYEEAGVKVLGVSKDNVASHQAFATKYKLTFPLIADDDGVWAAAFGVASRLGMYQRVTFLLGRDGKVAKVYDDVNPGLHATEVLADAAALPR